MKGNSENGRQIEVQNCYWVRTYKGVVKKNLLHILISYIQIMFVITIKNLYKIGFS